MIKKNYCKKHKTKKIEIAIDMKFEWRSQFKFDSLKRFKFYGFH